jgi:hypothetical protein
MNPRSSWPMLATLPVDVRAQIDQKHAQISQAANALVTAATTEILRGGSYLDLWGMVSLHAALALAEIDPTPELDFAEAILMGICAELALRVADGQPTS